MDRLLLVSAAIWLCVLNAPGDIHGELYTSVEELSNWSSIQMNLVTAIDVYMRTERERLDKLEALRAALIDSLERQDETNNPKPDSSESSQSIEAERMTNPISAYISLHRITKVIDEIHSLYEDEEANLRSTLQSLGEKGELASSEDLVGSAKALLRLQSFYGLKTSKLIEGQFSSEDEELDKHLQHYRPNNLHMDATDCFRLGKIAYSDGDFELSLGWFQKALDCIEAEQEKLKTPDLRQSNNSIAKGSDIDILISEILDYLAYAAYETGNIEYAAQITRRWLDKDPKNERAQSNLEYYQEMLEDDLGESYITEIPEDKPKLENSVQLGSTSKYEAGFTLENYDVVDDMAVRHLCKSVTQKSSDNKCFRKLQFKSHPLAPELKIETLHEDPNIIRILDLLTEEEASYLRKSALPKLRRSTVGKSGDLGPATTDFRIAKTAWLPKSGDQIVERIGKRVSEILKLDLNDSEDLQVVNYGLGGYYGPHLDARREESSQTSDKSSTTNQSKQNDRLATILIYLNNVEVGGATVFPMIGLTVQPVERSAVVWFNIQRNGLLDAKTMHSGCPVLLGSKWIATFWPGEKANSFLRPCGLTQLDK